MKTIKSKHGDILIDDKDYDPTASYSVCNRGGKSNPNLTVVVKHILARKIMGETNPEITIDHANRNPLDNRRINLRRASASENAMNRKKRAGARSQYKGVMWNSQQQKWTVTCSKQKKRVYGGVYDSETEAARAYDALACEMHGRFGVYNFPDEIQPKIIYHRLVALGIIVPSGTEARPLS